MFVGIAQCYDIKVNLTFLWNKWRICNSPGLLLPREGVAPRGYLYACACLPKLIVRRHGAYSARVRATYIAGNELLMSKQKGVSMETRKGLDPPLHVPNCCGSPQRLDSIAQLHHKVLYFMLQFEKDINNNL